LGLLTCKNRLPYNLYCVGGDVKHCSIQSKTGAIWLLLLMAMRDWSNLAADEIMAMTD